METSRPRYAFDIDGVLCMTQEPMKRWYLERYGVHLQSGGEWDTFGLTHPSERVTRDLRVNGLSVWREVMPDGEAQGQAVISRLLLEGRFLGYFTRRDPELRGATETWLRRCGFPAIELLFFPEEVGLGACKSGLVLRSARKWPEPSVSVLVEDSPKEAWMAAENGLAVRVLRASYNRDFERRWQQLRAEPHGEEGEAACRIDFVSSLEELL